MPAINQRIPNFLGGVSQQPDFIKFPGQLRTCHNAHPDVTFGLQKRPPGEYVGKLTNAVDGGQWFDIIRDDDEKYLVQVTTTGTPDIRVWNLATGVEQGVVFATNGPQNFNYLLGATDPLGKLTINDYTIITNPQKIVETARNTAQFQDNYAFVSLNEIAYNSEYVISLGNPNLTSTTKYRAEALEVVKKNTSSATWESSSSDASSTGKATFYGESTDGAWEDVSFTVTVNATHFVDGYTSNGGSPSANTNPDYHTQYTATVTLQENGKNVGSSNISRDITVNGTVYTVTIIRQSTYDSYSDSDAAIYRTPKSIRKGEISVDAVLGNLRNKIVAKYHGQGSNTCSVTVAGNGLYIQTNYAFGSIGTRGGLTGDALYAFTSSVQNISKLPGSCKDGYIVKVSNTEDADADDYYVKFITSGSGTGDVGSGIWEETVSPKDGDGNQLVAGFDYSTMPHALINYRNGNFAWTTLDPNASHQNKNDHDSGILGRTMNPTSNGRVTPTAWQGTLLANYWVDRTVGDDLTNPMPTFVGQGISALFFVRNRLGMISGEQTVISQPADYFNFFVNSAISGSDADPIDMAASDVKPAIIRHVIPMQKGILLFTEAAQFMLFTESEQFSPKTAQIKKMSSFDCSRELVPVDTGTSVIFASNKSSYTKVFELVVQAENAPPKVIEQTRVIPEYIPNDIDDICNSSTNGLVTCGKIGTSTLYTYKYFDGGNQREQSAWYSWGIEGNLIHQLYTGGNYFTITKQGSEWIIQRYELVVSSTNTRSYTIGAGTVGSPTNIARQFEACLDNMVDRSQVNDTQAIAYNSTTKKTTITYPYTIQNGTTNLRLVELADGNVRTPSSVSGATAVYDNVDLRSIEFATGYKYTTEVALPTPYFGTESKGAYDVNADLRIHRLNFELGVSGPLEFHLSDIVRNQAGTDGETFKDYIHYESGIINDISSLNKVPSQLYKSVSVPIYKKNTKYDMTIKVTAPFTATLVSASWDGKYNTRRHVRR